MHFFFPQTALLNVLSFFQSSVEVLVISLLFHRSVQLKCKNKISEIVSLGNDIPLTKSTHTIGRMHWWLLSQSKI